MTQEAKIQIPSISICGSVKNGTNNKIKPFEKLFHKS